VCVCVCVLIGILGVESNWVHSALRPVIGLLCETRVSCQNTSTFVLLEEKLRLKLYSSPNKIRMIKSSRMRWAGHVVRMGGTRNAYRILVGNSEGKRPLGRPRRRWVGNIKINPKEIGWTGSNWLRIGTSEGFL
jgi:hypothetical protein